MKNGGKQGNIRIGISGWEYKPWRGVFYPKDLPHNQELAYASRTFHTIEVNGTFYSLRRPENYRRWAAETPDDFVFSIKAPRYITHIGRLKESQIPLANFLASGILSLGPKLGPILWQLPPSFTFNADRLDEFLRLLPHDTKRAAAIARHHESWMKGRVYTKCAVEQPLRHALEIRHKSFATPDFITLLRKHDIALVCADTVEWPRLMDLTSDFVYCRLHGSEELYSSGYDKKAIAEWAERVAAWAQGGEPAKPERAIAAPGPKRRARDVFVYFDNDVKVRAPVDAQSLIKRLKQLLPEPI